MRREEYQQGGNGSMGGGFIPSYSFSANFATNTSGADAPPNSVFEIVSVADGLWTIQTPTEADTPATSLVVSPGHTVTAGTGVENFFRVAMCNSDFYVCIDTAAGVPVFGDEVGTLADSHKLSMGQTGFMVLEYKAGTTTARVRPLGGGEGTSITLVQAQSSGSLGTVSVKDIELKGDLTLSPNFQVTGSAYNVAYLKL
jgi:hypothetical protein